MVPRTLVMQTEDGQIEEAFTISAGLDYPGIGPMHADLATRGRSHVLAIKDDEAIYAGYELTRMEGIIPAIESAHAVAALEENEVQEGRCRCPHSERSRWLTKEMLRNFCISGALTHTRNTGLGDPVWPKCSAKMANFK